MPKDSSIILTSAKPGVQSFLFPTNEIQENVYARDKSVMERFLNMQGQLRAPEYNDGTPFDTDRQIDSEWLVTSVTYKNVFGWYEATVKYKYSNQGWDEDLYPIWQTS